MSATAAAAPAAAAPAAAAPAAGVPPEIEALVKKLGLNMSPHPEGGYYARIYTSAVGAALTPAFPAGAKRPSATAIYYLLPTGGKGFLHRLKSDELWFHLRGDPLVVVELTADGPKETTLGSDIVPTDAGGGGHVPTYTVPAGAVFGSYAPPGGAAGYSLVSCVVSPGFDFADFEMFTADQLAAMFPGGKCDAMIAMLNESKA